MVRSLLLAGAAACVFVGSTVAADWVTIKGQVIWPKGKEIPKRAQIQVNAQDKKSCEAKGPVLDDALIIDEKTRGLKNIYVYLRPDSDDAEAKFKPEEIHPDAKAPKAVVHEADQPCCLFTPRSLVLRSGDFVKFKNSADIGHNVNLTADAPSPSFNKQIAPGSFYQDPNPFVAQNTPINYSCSSHPWMKGSIMVFDHPYAVVTADDGKFEIKNAPAGNYRIVYRGDSFHKGKEGRRGFPVTIPAGKLTMDMEPLEFAIPPAAK
jgi:plastocyanin